MKALDLLQKLNRGSSGSESLKKAVKEKANTGKDFKKTRRRFIPTKLALQLQKTAEASNLANALISSIGEGLIIVDEYGHISHINNQALDILGFNRVDLEGAWMPGALQIKDKAGRGMPQAYRPTAKAILTGKPVTEIVHYQKKDGSLIPVSTTASPFLIKDQPRGVVIIFRDITKELQIEKAKDEFVSLASHQLRTPLTSIRFFTELLRDNPETKLNHRQKRYIEKILFSTEKMIELVTDLLNVSRLDLGQLTIRPEPTSVNRLIKLRIDEIRPIAQSQSLNIRFKSDLKDEQLIPIDRNLLAQVIHNLLSNALRYSRQSNGKIEITVLKKGKNVEISVKDDGIGIPKKDHKKIFDRFYRSDNAIEVQAQGTGLGLYFVKTIMEASGGIVSINSQEKKGTTFFITLPFSGMKPKVPE